jgi:hypothetical protein
LKLVCDSSKIETRPLCHCLLLERRVCQLKQRDIVPTPFWPKRHVDSDHVMKTLLEDPKQ